ncbi:unnamed protein product [Onchocerca ochengi]|uniref:protein-tyrosine-phosphatase n=1 Tax=Onchocerca ochengi TaxID=42157 RepID=A0A182EPK1_ONCOC|nr:unnamed protein product [Onchocerca ochengi]
MNTESTVDSFSICRIDIDSRDIFLDLKSGTDERLERTLEVRRTCDLAHKPENVRKNRFENVVIFDHCRIVLPVFGILFPYILAQDPLDEQTCYDFWCMIGEQNSRAVVMLSSESEFTPKRTSSSWMEDPGIILGRQERSFVVSGVCAFVSA